MVPCLHPRFSNVAMHHKVEVGIEALRSLHDHLSSRVPVVATAKSKQSLQPRDLSTVPTQGPRSGTVDDRLPIRLPFEQQIDLSIGSSGVTDGHDLGICHLDHVVAQGHANPVTQLAV